MTSLGFLEAMKTEQGFLGDSSWSKGLSDESWPVASAIRARRHAKDVLLMAASAGTPDTFWWTDSRIQRAIATLKTNVYAARRWAEWACEEGRQ